ncbi:hypothetical protein EV121DRAFT_267297 [Schizophyllum commune]
MATSASPALAIPDVRTSLGPILISSVLAWVLWGTLTMQVIRYYLSYKRDHTFVKWIAVLIGPRFLDLSHAIILFRGIYQCLVNDFGRVVPLDRARVMGEMPPRVLITIVVQGFCFWRIWKLYRSYIPIALYVVTSLLQIIFTIIYLMGSFGAVPAARRLFFLNLSGFGYLAAVLVADVTMASMLTTLLYKQHRETPYHKTSEMLRRLFYFSVNTGTWTAVFAVAAIILSKHPYGTNTLLVNLNGRDYVVGEQAVALSFYKSTGDSSRTARGSGSRGHRRSESAAVEDVSVFEAAKRSQVSDV